MLFINDYTGERYIYIMIILYIIFYMPYNIIIILYIMIIYIIYIMTILDVYIYMCVCVHTLSYVQFFERSHGL